MSVGTHTAPLRRCRVHRTTRIAPMAAATATIAATTPTSTHTLIPPSLPPPPPLPPWAPVGTAVTAGPAGGALVAAAGSNGRNAASDAGRGAPPVAFLESGGPVVSVAAGATVSVATWEEVAVVVWAEGTGISGVVVAEAVSASCICHSCVLFENSVNCPPVWRARRVGEPPQLARARRRLAGRGQWACSMRNIRRGSFNSFWVFFVCSTGVCANCSRSAAVIDAAAWIWGFFFVVDLVVCSEAVQSPQHGPSAEDWPDMAADRERFRHRYA